MKVNRLAKAKSDTADWFEDQKTEYCDNYYCESEAIKTVPVSVERAGDSQRKFCGACYDAYMIGVQHGRLSENPNAYDRANQHKARSRKSAKLRRSEIFVATKAK